MADAAASAGTGIFGFVGRGARFATEMTSHAPFGSARAKMSALTGLAEGLVVHRGSPWKALEGAVLGFLSTWTGELLQSWAENDTFGRQYVRRAVALATGAGDAIFGIQETPTLAALVGCVYGAVIGLFSGRERSFKIVSHALEHGFRRLIAAWASERVLNVAANVGRGGSVPTEISRWTPERTVNVTLEANPHPEVVHEDELQFLALETSYQRQVTNAEREVKAALQGFCAEFDIRLDPSRYHRLFVTAPTAAYDPLKGEKIGIEHSIDLPNRSHVRLNLAWLQREDGVARRDLRVAHAKAHARATLGTTRMVSEGDTLYSVSGYRKTALKQWPPLADPKLEARRELSFRAREHPTQVFDEAVDDLLAHLMLKIPIVPTKTNDTTLALHSMYEFCGNHKKHFIQELVRGKRENSFHPLYEFFTNGNVPPEGSDERESLHNAILAMDKSVLLRFGNVDQPSG